MKQHKQADIDQHKDPKFLPPRSENRKHYDSEISNDLKKEKEATPTPLTKEELHQQLDIPGRYLEVDFTRQDAILYWKGDMEHRYVNYDDVIELFQNDALKGIGHNQYIKVSRKIAFQSSLLKSDSSIKHY